MTSKEIDPKGQRVSAFCLCSLFSSFVYFVSSVCCLVYTVFLLTVPVCSVRSSDYSNRSFRSDCFLRSFRIVLSFLSASFHLCICTHIRLRARFRRARKPHVSISFLSFLSFVSLVCSLPSLLFVLTVLLFSSVFFVSPFFLPFLLSFFVFISSTYNILL